ncbi:MAG TPA: XRE family transcriptional regulator [Myxococcaceae bacterium]|nr:XRE family transcriptional regulator [Myxococcaceae bacterium]
MSEELASHLARNIKQLRDMRGLTQQQMAKASGLPRATWANLETGGANPTLSVLHRVATALQVSIEELISRPRTSAQIYPREGLPTRKRGDVTVRSLVPDPIPGLEMDRLQLPARGRMVGTPHTPGTREYLACESGEILLVAGGEQWRLRPGDVVSFRGDQRHSYVNDAGAEAVGYSVVVLAPTVR